MMVKRYDTRSHADSGFMIFDNTWGMPVTDNKDAEITFKSWETAQHFALALNLGVMAELGLFNERRDSQ